MFSIEYADRRTVSDGFGNLDALLEGVDDVDCHDVSDIQSEWEGYFFLMFTLLRSNGALHNRFLRVTSKDGKQLDTTLFFYTRRIWSVSLQIENDYDGPLLRAVLTKMVVKLDE